jgi:hypothetical protein
MGWYVLQIVIVFGLMFANIYFEWTESGWIGFAVSWGLAYAVTWLLGRLLDLIRTLRRAITYSGETHRDPTRLLTFRRHAGNAHQPSLRFRVREDARKLIEVSSRLPSRNQIIGKRRPLLGGKNSLRRITHGPTGPHLL